MVMHAVGVKQVPPLDPAELEFLQNPSTASSGRSGKRFTEGFSYCFFLFWVVFSIRDPS
jgi:hypothetical protein